MSRGYQSTNASYVVYKSLIRNLETWPGKKYYAYGGTCIYW